MKIYNNFEEVEQEISENTPRIIYKYRSWENDFHKKIITENEVWFAHPNTLNDPYDTKPPYNFRFENIDWEVLRNRMKVIGREEEPFLSDEKLEIEVEKRMVEIKKDPNSYFANNRKEYILDETNYDKIGVFSCCSSFSNEAMWAHYGNNHNGFAIGFNTVELARALNCIVGPVDYSNEPIVYKILENNDDSTDDEIFKKSTKWSYEEELRFVTLGIGVNRSRANKYPSNSVNEIVFGLTTSKEVQDEIIEIAKDKLPNIPIYKVEINPNQFGFNKRQIT